MSNHFVTMESRFFGNAFVNTTFYVTSYTSIAQLNTSLSCCYFDTVKINRQYRISDNQRDNTNMDECIYTYLNFVTMELEIIIVLI